MCRGWVMCPVLAAGICGQIQEHYNVVRVDLVAKDGYVFVFGVINYFYCKDGKNNKQPLVYGFRYLLCLYQYIFFGRQKKKCFVEIRTQRAKAVHVSCCHAKAELSMLSLSLAHTEENTQSWFCYFMGQGVIISYMVKVFKI